jgi:hypothetical protein
MSIKLFMDVHVRRAVSNTLRLRGVDVLTAQEDGSQEFSDPELLDRASSLGRVLFTQDSDLLAEGTFRQRNHLPFGGILYAHQLRISIGQLIDELELIAKASDIIDIENRIEYLPLR